MPLEVRLDAVAAVLLDGLSYRRAGRIVGISKTEVGVGDRRTKDRLSDTQRAYNRCQAGLRALVEQSIGIWPTPGRYAAGGAGSTASGTSSALPRRWSASAGGCTESPHDRAWRTPSMPSGCATCSRAACRRRLAGVRLDVTTWPRCDAESTCRSVMAVNAPTSGTLHGGAWHDAWPAEPPHPQPGVEGPYAGWLGAPPDQLTKPPPSPGEVWWRWGCGRSAGCRRGW
jgi:hypothetical protein